MKPISLSVNGKAVSNVIEPRTHLADFLREYLGLTGTHIGCEHGVCGACTVLVDGVPVRSCITLAMLCEGAGVVSIEGLDDDEIMVELREAFSREHALQCGYCTPGMLIAARDLIIRTASADERAIRIAMSGNLCRCTGYAGIVRAIASVIADRRAREIEPVAGAGRETIGPAGSARAIVESGQAPALQITAARASTQIPGQAVKLPIDSNWTPQASIDQSFSVAFPRERVWDMFDRIEELAACLPGATITGRPAPDRVEGQIRIKAGPIAAVFRGEARIERDAATYSGCIIGAGSDLQSGSSTRGVIRYRLSEGEDHHSTDVLVTAGYSLTGMLAQFARSGIVKDVAARLTASFIHNLEARLAGKSAQQMAGADPRIDVASLIFSAFASRIKEFLRRLFNQW